MAWKVRPNGTRTTWRWRVRRVNVLTGKLISLPGDTYEQRHLAFRYLHGKEEAHYPMPATFGQVFITSRNVYRANPQGWDSETYL